MSSVWILSRCIDYEGDSTMLVFSSKPGISRLQEVIHAEYDEKLPVEKGETLYSVGEVWLSYVGYSLIEWGISDV